MHHIIEESRAIHLHEYWRTASQCVAHIGSFEPCALRGTAQATARAYFQHDATCSCGACEALRWEGSLVPGTDTDPT